MKRVSKRGRFSLRNRERGPCNLGVSDMRIRYTLMKSHIKVFSIIHYTVIEENNLKYNR